MPLIRNLTAGCLALLCAVLPRPAAAQTETAEFLVFSGGRQIGREQVTVGTSGSDKVITSTGRHAAPIDITINSFVMRYSGDWQPIELNIDASLGDRPLGIKTSFGMTTAINEITQGGTTNAKTDQVSVRTVVLPNGFFGAYEALAARLAGATPGTEIPVYVVPQMEIKAQVKAVRDEQLKSPGGTSAAKVYELLLQNPGTAVSMTLTADARGRLVRIEIPVAGLSAIRSDIASVAVRQQTQRNPTDVDVRIPANGFSLAGTMTTPTQAAGRLRHPAVILVHGSGVGDRDATVFGIPLFKQLAGSLAEQGLLVVRYDKRGFGQSGGRIESATLDDFADDVLAAYRWLKRRKDVDKNRISIVGHSEGGAVAMLAAAKEDDVASLVLIGTLGMRGGDLILEQQRHQLDVMNVSEEDRAAKVDLQKRIQLAVMTGVGWESLPDAVRRQADTPWFRSLLLFDPAKVMTKVKQPVLIIQGELDKQVTPHHGQRLAEMARKRKKNPPVEFVQLPGVNHLMVRAQTGEVSEYADLKEKAIVPEVAARIAEFSRR